FGAYVWTILLTLGRLYNPNLRTAMKLARNSLERGSNVQSAAEYRERVPSRLFRTYSSSSITNTIVVGLFIVALPRWPADGNENARRLHRRSRRQWFRHVPRRSSARWQDPFRVLLL